MSVDHIAESAPPPRAALREATDLSVSGMTCGNCARHVTEAIQSVPGVHSATVSLDSRQATVGWKGGADQNVPAIIQAIEAEGYGAKVIEAHPHKHDHGERALAGWQLSLWIGVLGTVPLMIGEWVFRLGLTPWFQWLSFALPEWSRSSPEPNFIVLMAATQGAQFQHGHPGRARIDHRVCLQRLGAVDRARGPSTIHGSRRDHYPRQHRALD